MRQHRKVKTMDSQVFHLTSKTGSKKQTIAICVLHSRACLAKAESTFFDHSHDVNARGISVEYAEIVTKQKMWKGYADNCPVYNDMEDTLNALEREHETNKRTREAAQWIKEHKSELDAKYNNQPTLF
jgi:hypothetical protein